MTRSSSPITIAVIASLAGLLFGYDTAVIAGALPFLTVHFSLDTVQIGFAVTSALIGCVIGSLVSGRISDALGRRRVLLIAAVLYAASSIGCAFAWDFTSFWAFRLVGGLGIGLSAIVPAYIAEISPARMRGRLTSVYQLAITVGILIVYVVNNLVAGLGDTEYQVTLAWRLMLGSETIPAVLFVLLIAVLPESPRWLAAKGRGDEAALVLARLDPDAGEDRIAEIRADLERERKTHAVRLLSKALLPILILACSIAALQQLVGINVIIYYGTSLMAQMQIDEPFLQQVLIGSVNVGATVLGMLVVDRWGRRPLMVLGSLGVAIMITVVGVASVTGTIGTWVMIFILGYILIFAATLGPLVWLVIAELPPSLARARVVAAATTALWLANIAVAQTFPMLNDSTFNVEVMRGSLPFFLYGLFAAVLCVVSLRFVKETKGATLEQLSAETIHAAQPSERTAP